jgi:hypothetical protein
MDSPLRPNTHWHGQIPQGEKKYTDSHNYGLPRLEPCLLLFGGKGRHGFGDSKEKEQAMQRRNKGEAIEKGMHGSKSWGEECCRTPFGGQVQFRSQGAVCKTLD